MKKIFVDGQEGTTGLQIHERLAKMPNVEVLVIDPAKRKDPKAKSELLNAADVVFLCLPDDASRESAALITNPNTVIIDASTAHRTDAQWTYGLPELSPSHREAIKHSKRIANPGCHATGFNLLVYPLVKTGIISPDMALHCHSLTGYSGGGKKMIASYESPQPVGHAHQAGVSLPMLAPRPYGLSLAHKHLPEMKSVCGLKHAPVFHPIVGPFYQGMIVTVPLHIHLLQKAMSAETLQHFFSHYYADQDYIQVFPYEANPTIDGGFLDATAANGTNRADIFVFGHAEQASLVCRLDNLGKGASGAAVQSMELVLG